MMHDRPLIPLVIDGQTIHSRLFLGTGKFSSSAMMKEAIDSSGTQIVTVALRRIDLKKTSLDKGEDLLAAIDRTRVHLLPNTSGARNAKEAIFLAQLARECGLGHWLKLEVIPDHRYLMPDPIETLKAAEILTKEGFQVFPYIQADPVLCRRLADAGCPVVMPMASPIGSNRGLRLEETLRIIIEQSTVPVVVDAGLGAPSHAAHAMELGADAVLVNTAIATAENPVAMARAFSLATEAGYLARQTGLAKTRITAEASSPLEGFEFLK